MATESRDMLGIYVARARGYRRWTVWFGYSDRDVHSGCQDVWATDEADALAEMQRLIDTTRGGGQLRSKIAREMG